jgi:hypothetical protein
MAGQILVRDPLRTLVVWARDLGVAEILLERAVADPPRDFGSAGRAEGFASAKARFADKVTLVAL